MDKSLIITIMCEHFDKAERRRILRENLTKVIELTSDLTLKIVGCNVFAEYIVHVIEPGKETVKQIVTALDVDILPPL